ncbi:hypothetical protein Tco_0894810 [Tanacetum coccineum]|uniref:Integrase, catalytic region, zinc finger, CCHC-type, peptidase aspartic, catalytic n=1 Tax=Tanacetum coccineum TaxID=301880 RepID=A0ABQ5CFF7_9ASTR
MEKTQWGNIGSGEWVKAGEGFEKGGSLRETLAEGAIHLGLKRDRVFADLKPEEKERFKADIRATNILLQGFELTKDERESQLYNDFEHFRQNKGETIHEYFVRFTKLINDMINIKMTMPKMRLNSKFVNNMLPEWGRFVTAVKLNRGLKTSNYDQLYAYLKQHEAHANKNKMMLERYNQHAIDPLAFGRQNRGQGNYAKGAVAARNGGVQNRVGNANPGGQTNTVDNDVDEAPVQDLALNEDNIFQADQCDAFDFDVDEAPTAQTMFMANLSSVDLVYNDDGPSYDSNFLSEVQDHDNYLDSVGEYHEVHEMQNDVQPNYVVESDDEYTSDGNIISYEQYVKDNVVPVVQSNLSSVPNDTLMMIKNDMHEQSAQCVSANEQNKVVNESLTVELARYKEQVKLYEKRASLTEGEMGFKQTKECYLTEVIPFFKMLKEHFEEIQTALVKEVKKMKDIFEQMEAEVEQNVVDKPCANIEQKNLLTENLNLITDCLSNELLYSVMNDVNTVSRFSEIHDAYTVEQARRLELESEISKLKHKIQKDDHTSLQGKDNAIRKLKVQISQMNERRSEADHILDFKALDSQNIEIKEHVTALQDQNERFRAENEKVKQHYKELYDSIKITCAKTIENTSSLSTKNEKLKAQLKGKIVNSSTKANGSKLRSNTKNNKILPAKSDNKKKVEDHSRFNKSNLKQKNRVDSSISSKRTIINSNSNYVCKTCNKCLISTNHGKCVVKYLKFVHAPPPLVKSVMSKVKQVWKATGKLFANIGTSFLERQSVKVKEIQERCIIKAFQDYQIKKMYEHVGPEVTSSQDGKVYKMAKRDYAWLMISRSSKITFMSRQKNKLTSKVNDHYIKSQVND